MAEETQTVEPIKVKRWPWVIGFVVIIIIVGALAWRYWAGEDDTSKSASQTDSTATSPVIPQRVLDNKFGFLGGGSKEDSKIIVEYGAAWVRPHPGPFLWDAMQSGTGEKIDFSQADEIVRANQTLEIGTLATLWPFADWDQEISASAANCQVSANDEFLPKSKESSKKGRADYLPKYRCKPVDWNKYAYWVGEVVERYDGDGTNDMPGLKLPVKYWEVSNEPDLTAPPEDNGRLDFWKGSAADYAELLIKTSSSIKAADPNAQVLIAGAAGGDKDFLDFYREVFKNKETHSVFDIANVHCISNDEKTHDFNVGAYKNMLQEFSISKPIWVTEAEAFYRGNKTAEENFQSTKTSTSGAIAAGAQRIFFTRSNFGDLQKDTSDKVVAKDSYPSAAKYQELIKSLSN